MAVSLKKTIYLPQFCSKLILLQLSSVDRISGQDFLDAPTLQLPFSLQAQNNEKPFDVFKNRILIFTRRQTGTVRKGRIKILASA